MGSRQVRRVVHEGRGRKVAHNISERRSSVGALKSIARTNINRVGIRRTDKDVGVVIELFAIDVSARTAIAPGISTVVAYLHAQLQCPAVCAPMVDINSLSIGRRYCYANIARGLGRRRIDETPGLSAISRSVDSRWRRRIGRINSPRRQKKILWLARLDRHVTKEARQRPGPRDASIG